MRPIDADKIRYVYAPIAPVLVGDEEHYENIAFQSEIEKLPTIDDHGIPRLPSAIRWIPVGKRLPNDDDYHDFAQFPDGAVLWCTDKGIVGAGWYYESTKSWSCLDDTFPERYGNVIAWMPLPEPFRREES